jgi:hypothetical protein
MGDPALYAYHIRAWRFNRGVSGRAHYNLFQNPIIFKFVILNEA